MWAEDLPDSAIAESGHYSDDNINNKLGGGDIVEGAAGIVGDEAAPGSNSLIGLCQQPHQPLDPKPLVGPPRKEFMMNSDKFVVAPVEPATLV